MMAETFSHKICAQIFERLRFMADLMTAMGDMGPSPMSLNACTATSYSL